MSTYEKVAEVDHEQQSSKTPMVVFASSLGTVFEWYDFFLVGALATNISQHMFSGLNPTAAFILTLLSFASGFAVRPLGAAVFGRLGDVFGRKYTFLVTIVIMGAATFVIGLLPDYQTIGIAAPILFVAIRMLQGLALGGEYGGAVTYVAEHSPAHRRGFFTSWIQVTAGLGLLLSLLVILITRQTVGDEKFAEWGWRIPFLTSAALLAVSVWVRMKLSESPVFLKMKEEGRQSKAPLKEALTDRKNLKLILASMFGPVIGEAVVWYTGQFYALYFLVQSVKLSPSAANVMMVVATIITLPLYVAFGALSDRIGRKPVMMAGCALAIVFFFPLFHSLTHYLNPALEQAERDAPVVLYANPGECSIQFNPVGTAKFTKPCDIAKAALAKAGIRYENRSAAAGANVEVEVGSARLASVNGANTADVTKFNASLNKLLSDSGYPMGNDKTQAPNYLVGTLIIAILMVFGIMLYGPIGAFMVELFPARIRYTSMSLPYHIGIGWFGGFLPATSFAIVAATGNPYAGLWYPVVIAAFSLLVTLFFVRETRQNTLD
ncbi:MFS transporter [Burkholderia sp. KK1]|nr:MFS transporter [Burkholderia sp. KK1]